MKKIGIIGAGTMGSGIAQILALKSLEVTLIDIDEGALEKGLDRIKKNLERSHAKERISQAEMENALSLITVSSDWVALKEMDLILEAAAEDFKIKVEIFKQLDKICEDKTIFATNTSSLSISQLALETNREEQFIGMHFFNPVPVMKLVEIVKGAKTNSQTVKLVKDLAHKLDKRPVEVLDSPGFIVNRLLIPMINEAAVLYGENVASPEAIDKAMELGANHPIGPLALADLIGIDVCLAIMESLHQSLKNDKYQPAQILKEKVKQGHLGRKSKKGFYDYNQ